MKVPPVVPGQRPTSHECEEAVACATGTIIKRYAKNGNAASRALVLEADDIARTAMATGIAVWRRESSFSTYVTRIALNDAAKRYKELDVLGGVEPSEGEAQSEDADGSDAATDSTFDQESAHRHVPRFVGPVLDGFIRSVAQQHPELGRRGKRDDDERVEALRRRRHGEVLRAHLRRLPHLLEQARPADAGRAIVLRLPAGAEAEEDFDSRIWNYVEALSPEAWVESAAHKDLVRRTGRRPTISGDKATVSYTQRFFRAQRDDAARSVVRHALSLIGFSGKALHFVTNTLRVAERRKHEREIVALVDTYDRAVLSGLIMVKLRETVASSCEESVLFRAVGGNRRDFRAALDALYRAAKIFRYGTLVVERERFGWLP